MSQVEVNKGDWVRIGERNRPYIVTNPTPDVDGDIKVARLHNQKVESFANLSQITHVIPGGLKGGDEVYVRRGLDSRVVRTGYPDRDGECTVYSPNSDGQLSYVHWTEIQKPINSTSQSENTQETKQQKETTMSNQAGQTPAQRQVVQVIIVDPDSGLKPEDALVADLGQHVLQGPVDNLKLKLAMSPNVNLQSKLNAHNTKRSKLVDLDILNRTGQEVKMQPIEIEDLVWQIK